MSPMICHTIKLCYISVIVKTWDSGGATDAVRHIQADLIIRDRIRSSLFQKLLWRLSERLIKAVADRLTGHARLAAPGFCARMS